MEERYNGDFTLAQVRAGTRIYQYDPTNTANAGVKVVQEALHMYGFNLTADGKFGSTTKAVVTGFQVENELTQTGTVNKETLLKLESWCGTLYETQPLHPATKQVQYGLATLHSGDSGDAVILVRDLLKQHGYTCAAIGSYDSALETVVKKFQQDKGITVTGNVNQVTLAVLQDLTADTAWLNGSTVNLTPGKLARAGFFGILIKPEIVADINKGLNKYGITTGEKVLHYLAQMMGETSGSQNIMENGYLPGIKGGAEFAPYYGAGTLHLTWKKQYEGFSGHINNAVNGYPKDPDIYPGQIDKDGTCATQHVALKYPGVSGGWFWEKVRELNLLENVSWNEADTNPRLISDQLTKEITRSSGSTLAAHQKQRFTYYEAIKERLHYKK